MKIIALLPQNTYSPPGVIAELSGSELERLLGGARYAKFPPLKPGDSIEINKRFDHANDILSAAEAAKKLPQALRAFADTLETLHPAIDDIADPVIDASFEVTP